MEKKLYVSPMLKIHILNSDRILQGITSEEVGPGFEEGAKGGFFDDGGSLPSQKNVWNDDF